MYALIRRIILIMVATCESWAVAQELFDVERLPEVAESSDEIRPQPEISQTRLLSSDERAPVRLSVQWAWSEPVRNQPATLGLNSEQLGLGVPLAIYDDGIWLALGSLQRTDVSTSAILPDSGLAFPEELWNISVGTMRIKTLSNGTQVGGMLQVGSASDRPFADIRDMTLTTLAFATVPYGPTDAWNFSLFYSPTSQTRFPLPGIAYVWRPSDWLQANIGLPASLDYRPTDSWHLMARFTPLTNLLVEGRYSFSGPWHLFGRYEIANETYWLDERLNSRDRFFMFDQRVSAGISRDLNRGFRLDAAAVYRFDRQFFQAESFFGDRQDVVQVESGPGVWIQLIWTR
ncbi:MAG: hypothetical protein U0795_23030 [Pirellulales bacterium]